MDQMTATLGRKDELLELLCQPAEVRGYARIPDELAVWGIDSGIRHQVSGADYTSVRTAAFMGYRIIAEEAGLEAHPTETPDPVRMDDPHWHGYLANVTPAEFQRRFAAELPESMRGDEFLRRYAGTTDPVTRVLPEVDYPVLAATAHPIDEHDRVTRFARLLGERRGAETWQALGELMYGSHASYSRCGLGSDGTDDLVRRVRDRGPTAGLFGAKITGGGCGGTVAVLGRADAGDVAQALAEQYARDSGHDPTVFAGSSDGAAATGCLRLVPAGADGLG
jgi:L-arabinokinase